MANPDLVPARDVAYALKSYISLLRTFETMKKD